jgi:hypothetical protein
MNWSQAKRWRIEKKQPMPWAQPLPFCPENSFALNIEDARENAFYSKEDQMKLGKLIETKVSELEEILKTKTSEKDNEE